MKFFVCLGLVAILALQYRYWFGDAGHLTVVKLTERIETEQRTNDRLDRRNRLLAAEIAALKDGLDAVEGAGANRSGHDRGRRNFFSCRGRRGATPAGGRRAGCPRRDALAPCPCQRIERHRHSALDDRRLRGDRGAFFRARRGRRTPLCPGGEARRYHPRGAADAGPQLPVSRYATSPTPA